MEQTFLFEINKLFIQSYNDLKNHVNDFISLKLLFLLLVREGKNTMI